MLLQVTLAQVLQLALGEAKLGRRGNRQLGSVSGNSDIVGSQGTGLVSDLDAIVQVLFKGSNIENLIIDRLCAVDDKLNSRFLSLNLSSRVGDMSASCFN